MALLPHLQVTPSSTRQTHVFLFIILLLFVIEVLPLPLVLENKAGYDALKMASYKISPCSLLIQYLYTVFFLRCFEELKWSLKIVQRSLKMCYYHSCTTITGLSKSATSKVRKFREVMMRNCKK